MKANKFLLVIILLITFIGQSFSQAFLEENDWKSQFNSYPNSLRIIMTNDPSCPGCLEMVTHQLEIYEDPNGCGLIPSIHYFFDWTKVFTTTKYSDAVGRAALFPDPTGQGRYHHYYDSTQVLSDKIQNLMGLIDPSIPPGASNSTGVYTGWHTILMYEPGITWGNTVYPPLPTYWMHKLDTIYNADPALYFDSTNLAINFSALACQISSIGDDNMKSKIVIYPNPSEGNQINLQINASGKENKLVIKDITGKLILEEQIISSASIDLSSKLGAGTYIISLFEDNHTITSRKIIVTP